jgi:hypothetical protein
VIPQDVQFVPSAQLALVVANGSFRGADPSPSPSPSPYLPIRLSDYPHMPLSPIRTDLNPHSTAIGGSYGRTEIAPARTNHNPTLIQMETIPKTPFSMNILIPGCPLSTSNPTATPPNQTPTPTPKPKPMPTPIPFPPPAVAASPTNTRQSQRPTTNDQRPTTNDSPPSTRLSQLQLHLKLIFRLHRSGLE